MDELVLADGKLPRFVYWAGQLFALPNSLKAFWSFKLLSCEYHRSSQFLFFYKTIDLLCYFGSANSVGAKLRAGFGLFGFIARRPQKEESIKEFTVRHLGMVLLLVPTCDPHLTFRIRIMSTCSPGEEVFERVVDPFVSGVYAGNPNKLGMKSALSKV